MTTAVRFLAIAIVLVGCSQAGAPAGELTGPTRSHRGVVIGQVVTHDSKVSIVGGGPDLRFVVRKVDGTMVADGISLAELRARDADLYEVVTSARASADGKKGNFIDATLDRGHLN